MNFWQLNSYKAILFSSLMHIGFLFILIQYKNFFTIPSFYSKNILNSSYLVKKKYYPLSLFNLQKIQKKSCPSIVKKNLTQPCLGQCKEQETTTPFFSKTKNTENVENFEEHYSYLIYNKIKLALRYPQGLQKKGIFGKLIIVLKINNEGEVESTQIKQSSGFNELDQLALDAVERSVPFPTHEKQKIVSLNIPIEFQLRKSL